MVKKTEHDRSKEKARSDDDDFVLKAHVIGVEPGVEPIRSVVVKDQRDTFGKRLGFAAFVIFLLFFVITGYIQSSKNGRDLAQAKKDRHALIQSIELLTESNRNLNAQVDQLQDALRQQNELLKKAGFKTIQIPEAPSSIGRSSNSGSGTTSSPSSSSSTSSKPPKPRSSSSARPSSRPSPRPSSSPSSDPVTDTKNNVCRLTGICLSAYFEEHNGSEQQAVRPAQVYCTGVVACGWNAILRALADLGFALWW